LITVNAPRGAQRQCGSADREKIDMKSDDLVELARRVEQADGLSGAKAAEVVDALRSAFPACIPHIGSGADMLESAEVALRIVDRAVPAWDISLKGVAIEPNGQWHCTLREESTGDDDAIVGFGQAPSLPRSMIAALLRIAAGRPGSQR
jgi:hypothetical protein